MRLNKYLSSCGICSRREADRLIEDGRVTVDGRTPELGLQLSGQEQVCLDGKPVQPEADQIYLAYYKPRGIVCTFEKKEKQNLLTNFSYPRRVTYAGRLDRESEGLLILSNDGDHMNRMMRARNAHEKEYVVTIDQKVTEDFLEKLQRGVYLPELAVTTRPCQVKKSGRCEFHIVLTQGLNRQIRRMCEAEGRKVLSLKRIRVMNIRIGDLKPGEYRDIEGEELRELLKALEGEQDKNQKCKTSDEQ